MAKPNGRIIIEPENTPGIGATGNTTLEQPNGTVSNNSSQTGDTVIAGYETFDPGTVSESTTGSDSGNSDSAPRKRGRPKGSVNRNTVSTQKGNTKTLEGLNSLLFSIHMMGATILKTPELMLDPTEAKSLADAIAEVSKFYPVGLSPKTLAWVNLAMVAGGIYGPRIIAMMNKPKETKQPIALVPTPKQQPVVAENKPNGKVATGPSITNPSQVYGDAIGVQEFEG